MSLLDYFRVTRPNSAALAKERLQILVAHERAGRSQPSYLPRMQKELLDVVRKYINVSRDAISITMEQEGNAETLELSIILPDTEADTKRARS